MTDVHCLHCAHGRFLAEMVPSTALLAAEPQHPRPESSVRAFRRLRYVAVGDAVGVLQDHSCFIPSAELDESRKDVGPAPAWRW